MLGPNQFLSIRLGYRSALVPPDDNFTFMDFVLREKINNVPKGRVHKGPIVFMAYYSLDVLTYKRRSQSIDPREILFMLIVDLQNQIAREIWRTYNA